LGIATSALPSRGWLVQRRVSPAGFVGPGCGFVEVEAEGGVQGLGPGEGTGRLSESVSVLGEGPVVGVAEVLDAVERDAFGFGESGGDLAVGATGKGDERAVVRPTLIECHRIRAIRPDEARYT